MKSALKEILALQSRGVALDIAVNVSTAHVGGVFLSRLSRRVGRGVSRSFRVVNRGSDGRDLCPHGAHPPRAQGAEGPGRTPGPGRFRHRDTRAWPISRICRWTWSKSTGGLSRKWAKAVPARRSSGPPLIFAGSWVLVPSPRASRQENSVPGSPEAGCAEVQGYWIGRPVSREHLSHFVSLPRTWQQAMRRGAPRPRVTVIPQGLGAPRLSLLWEV